MKNQQEVSRARLSRSTRCLVRVWITLMVLIAPVSGASAVTIDGSSRSYLQNYQSISGDTLVPGYEYLDLSISDIGTEELSVHFGGWGRYDFKQETGKTDLQYAYVSWKRRTDNTIVNLGRVMVFEGVAAERVDGAFAGTQLARNFSVSAFGGVPAETGTDLPGNNLIYGARIAHQRPGLYRIGISALQEEKDDTRFRQEEGVDLWLRPVDKVEVMGRSVYDSIDDTWMEHNYSLVLGPFAKFRFTTDAWRYDYASLLRTATTPALLFTAGVLNPAENASALGEEVAFAATNRLTLFAHYRFYQYQTMGDAQYYGGRVNYSSGKEGAVGAEINRMAGEDDPRLRYTEYRVYAARTFGKLNTAIDLIDVNYDESIAGMDNAYSASLALAYDLTPSLRIGADGEYRTSPTVERDFRFLAKIIYRFGFKIGGGA